MTPLRDIARSLDHGWRRTRAAAADRGSLASLSDRELLDIGLRDCGTRCVDERPWVNTFPS